MNNFTHLHLHDEFSALDGVGKSDIYAQEASRLGFRYLAETNHGNCDGLLKFQKACLKHNIIPICGAELYIVPDITKKDKYEKKYHITVLVQNKIGFSNLLKMLTIANLEGHYYRPRVSPEIILQHSEGLVFMSACVSSFINMEGGIQLLTKLSEKVPTYLEIMPHNYDIQKQINLQKIELSKQYNIPLVATQDVHYPRKENALTQEMLLAIQKKAKWNDPKRWKFDFGGLYLKSEEEMIQAFQEQNCVPKNLYLPAMERTMEIAEVCGDFRIRKRKVILPKVYGYEHRDETELMRELIESGLKERKTGDYNTYRQRLEEEFEIICKLNFQRYFLIVWELIEWCKRNNIMTGPGRGSSAGSIVCYLMGITDVDPIKYKLIFARFISPSRTDNPDIDCDFPDNKRDEIRKHLQDCYGEYNVAGISTFLELKGRGALRDVSRVFDLPLKEVDNAAKEIVVKPDGDPRCNHTIEDSCKNSDVLKSFKRKYPEAIELAIQLEGQVKSTGQHAAGIVVSSDDLRKGERCNLCIRNGVVVSNWDKDDAEEMGLMKLDVLGLTSLTILNNAKKFINNNYNIDIEFDEIPLNDKNIYKEISEGNNVGAFQINSPGLIELCKELKVKEFEDIVLATTLYRPGTLQSHITSDFIKRRKGEAKIEYIHPKLIKYTKDSLGLVIYQEQIMWSMFELAGLPWSVCDKVRKVIGKSQGEAKFQKFKKQFVDGCKENKTLSEKEADKVWDMFASFGKYSFNKTISENAWVLRTGTNQYTETPWIQIKELVKKWNERKPKPESWKQREGKLTPIACKLRAGRLKIIQMDDDGKCRPGRLINIHDHGIKPVFEIITESGYVSPPISKNHRLMTNNGYKTINTGLSIDDFLLFMGEEIPIKKKYQRNEAKGKHYQGMGMPKGKENPAWIDGRQVYFNKAIAEVKERANGLCEDCKIKESDGGRFKFAHLLSLEKCEYDYSKYHNKNNIKRLCNSCHKTFDYKKGERVKRYQKGKPTFGDKIIEIRFVGEHQCYDLEMDTDGHNYVASSDPKNFPPVISHNSHATSYSMITYWCCWLKYYYPKEFLCACLTYGGEDKKAEYVNEARRLGLEVSLPKINKSLADVWYPNKDSNIIYAPLTEIKGVGKTQAEKIIEQNSNKKVGFFTIMDQSVVPTNSTDELLNKVGFYKKTSLTQKELMKARQYLNFNPLTGMNRFSRLPKDLDYSDDDIIKCNLEGFEGNLIEIKKYVKKIECDKCELRKEAKAPVSSSFGRYNIMVLGESPWIDEDREGIGFVGKTGKEILWPEFKKHGLHRDMFHISNVIKCKIKNPSKKQIPPCSHHIVEEIENLKPILILAFGNTNVRFFKEQDGGIMKLNSETEWSDKFQCWICWSIHPSAVIYHDAENRPLFEKGIKNFADKINMIGGNWLRKNKEQILIKKCSYGGKFGIDNNEYEECSQCKIWFDCTKIAMNEDFK